MKKQTKSLDKLLALLEESPLMPMAEITDEVVERSYIGGSSIGHPCERSVALKMRGFPVDIRSNAVNRLLRLGHLLEEEILSFVDDLINDATNGLPLKITNTGSDQKQYKTGVVKASPDAVIFDVERKEEAGLVEIKSANDASFSSTQRLGVQYAFPSYYDQMQLLMGLSGLKNMIFIMTNKNNSNILAENIAFDDTIYHYLLARSEYIADGNDEKCAKVSTDFRCSLCSYKQVCWFDAPVKEEERTCRHCVYSTIPELDTKMFSMCQHPKGFNVNDGETIWTKRNIAKTCPYFTDHREKDLKSFRKTAVRA